MSYVINYFEHERKRQSLHDRRVTIDILHYNNSCFNQPCRRFFTTVDSHWIRGHAALLKASPPPPVTWSARALAVKYTDNPRVIRRGPLQATNVQAGH